MHEIALPAPNDFPAATQNRGWLSGIAVDWLPPSFRFRRNIIPPNMGILSRRMGKAAKFNKQTMSINLV